MKSKWIEWYVRNIWIIVLVFLMLCGSVLIGAACLKNIERRQYEERVANSNVLMEKIGHHVESAMSFNWKTLHYIEQQIERERYPSLKAMQRMLQDCEENLQENFGQQLLLVDKKGICHTATGEEFRWQATDLLLEEIDRVYISDYQIASDEKMQMFFLTRLSEPIRVGDVTFTHLSLVNNMQMFDEFFDVSSYEDEGITFIIHKNGSQVYRQEKETALSGIYNVLSVLEQGDFHYNGSIEKVKQDIALNLNDSVNVTCKDATYFVSYYHLNINDWLVLLMVPEKYVGAGTDLFVNSIIMNVLTIFGVVVAVTGILLLIIGRIMHRKQTEINLQLRKAAEAERVANEAKTRFLSSMSHDIRTPMNAIVGMTLIASKRLDDPEYMGECLGKIKQASNHLLMLINDILDISKVEAGKMVLTPSFFSLADSTTNLVNIVQPQVKEKGLEFNIRVHSISHEMIYGDELRLNQIFINILTNAVKFTNPGGRVDVEIWEETVSELQAEEGQSAPERVRLYYRVSDSGIGMSEEFQKSMYHSFARETDSRISKIQGSGLGLAICKQMIDLMGGSIDCESEEGVGTTFTIAVELPVEAQEPMAELPAMRLLLVDDDEIFLETATDTMEDMGLKVDSVTCGEDALRCVWKEFQNGNGYPIVIIDKRLPGMDGIETTREIRSRLGDEVPIILISAYDTSEFEKEAMEAGANSVISKPFFRSVLHQQICSLLKLDKQNEQRREPEEEQVEHMNLLVAEDNDMNWEILHTILEMHGIAAERAENGQCCVEMMEEAQKNAYDLILMDVRMPVMGGREATRLLRASKQQWIREIPIIAMTADAFSEDIQACLDAGMDEHLAKPLDVSKLLKKLEKIRGGYAQGSKQQRLTGRKPH